MTEKELFHQGDHRKEIVKNGKLVIPAYDKKVDFIDFIFRILIPRENEIDYPAESEWDELIGNVLMSI